MKNMIRYKSPLHAQGQTSLKRWGLSFAVCVVWIKIILKAKEEFLPKEFEDKRILLIFAA